MMKLLNVFILAMTVFASTDAFAVSNCFCKASITQNITSSMSGEIKSYTTNLSWNGAFQQNEEKQNICKNHCKALSDPDIYSVPLGAIARSAGAPRYSYVRVWSKVGTANYRIANTLGRVGRKSVNGIYVWSLVP